MAGSPEYFISDATGTRGPFAGDALRAELAAAGADARVRVEGCEPWLDPSAWEAFADLRPSPDLPSMPGRDHATELPPDLAAIAPSVRERLRWFVADADGVLGPISGEEVKRGLAQGRIKLGAGVSVVGTDAWVRASIAFPSALEAATAVRPRLAAAIPCAACLEPCLAGEVACGACGESLAAPPPPPRRALVAAVVLGSWLIVAALSVVVGWLLRSRGN